RSPCPTIASGSVVRPTTSATGCAQPEASSAAATAANAPNRRPAPSDHSARAEAGVPTVTLARSTSARKLTTASATPAAAPMAPAAPPSQPPAAARTTPSAHTSRVTRLISSLGVIERPLRRLDRSKEAHEPRGDPEAEPDEGQPRLGTEPAIREVPAGQT